MPLPKIPSLSEFPEFVQAQERLRALHVEAGKVSAEIESLRANPPRLTTDAAIEALIAGERLEASQSVTEWQSRLEHLHERHRMLTEAARVQRGRVSEARAAAASQIVTQIRPAYAALQARMASAVAAVGKLADEETEWREALTVANIPFSDLKANALSVMRLNTKDNGSAAVEFLRRAEADHGVKVGK